MSYKFFCVACVVVLVMANAGAALASPEKPGAPMPFHGKVYQVDTVYNNIDVIMPDRTRTFWADDATRVKVHRAHAHLIDISMGDEVRGTYAVGPHGKMKLMTIEDVTGN